MKGKFIVFEGIEGCGKSTQVAGLYKNLMKSGIDCTITREPGGTELGEKIREILLHSSVFPMTELLLFLADRNQHINEIIRPSLEAGRVVISDRFYFSTYAYQAIGRKINMDTVIRLNEIAVEGIKPDITFFIDIPTETGFLRKKTADLQLDRIEQEDFTFHNAVRNAYLDIYEKNRDLIIKLDGKSGIDELQNNIFSIVKERFFDIFDK
jgi:dTMP kinase